MCLLNWNLVYLLLNENPYAPPAKLSHAYQAVCVIVMFEALMNQEFILICSLRMDLDAFFCSKFCARNQIFDPKCFFAFLDMFMQFLLPYDFQKSLSHFPVS